MAQIYDTQFLYDFAGRNIVHVMMIRALAPTLPDEFASILRDLPWRKCTADMFECFAMALYYHIGDTAFYEEMERLYEPVFRRAFDVFSYML